MNDAVSLKDVSIKMVWRYATNQCFLVTLFSVYLICSFQYKYLSSKTPRSFIDSNLSISLSFSNTLKELRKYKRKLFCVRYKNRRKRSQHYKLLFFHNKFTLCDIEPNIYVQKTKFFSQKQYLFTLLTSRNKRKTQADQSIPHAFLLYLKRNDPQTFKSGSSKKPFSPVFMLLIQFASINVFYSM